MLAPRKISILPSFLQEISSQIVLFQSLNTSTGGTTAMRLLYRALKDLHFQHVTLCNETNHLTLACRRPSDRSIVVTGEWCHGVQDEYFNPANNPSGHYQFRGRGIQYHLGFHVGRDLCRGFVSSSVSHGLATLLGSRNMHAYYLGSPMSESIHENFDEIVRHVFAENISRDKELLEVEKEDLVLVDFDYVQDYPPEVPIYVATARPVQKKLIRGIRGDHMPLFYQRSKVVMDLALPGAERVCAEAVLFGAVPVVSSRWMGASDVDFPVHHKVDALNPTASIAAIESVLDNYEAELQRPQHKAYFRDVVSLKSQLANTADWFFASSSLHFVLIATSLEEEYWMNMQVLAVWYLFPLASVDIYVRDVLWFVRHHYFFLDLLKQAGYLSIDLFDPKETNYKFDNNGNAEDSWKSFFCIKSLVKHFGHFLDGGDVIPLLGNSDMVPDWKPVFVYIPQGMVFTSAEVILGHAMGGMQREDIRVLGKLDGEDVLSAMAVLASPYASFKNFSSLWKEVLNQRVGSILPHYDMKEIIPNDSAAVKQDLPRRFVALDAEEDVMSVCELWRRGVANLPFRDHKDALLEGVRNTSSWKLLTQQLSELRLPDCAAM